MPKKKRKKDSSKIFYFGPISLVTSLYKIISEIMSSHLRRVLNETNFLFQGAFVEGGQILDTILIANEMVDEKKKSLGEERVVFNLIYFDLFYRWVGMQKHQRVTKILRQCEPDACDNGSLSGSS